MSEHIPTVQISAATHKGNVRRSNEDAVLVGDWLGWGESATHAAERAIDAGGLLLAVADGLGGHQAGEVASRFLVEQLSQRAVPTTLEQEDRLIALLQEIDADLRHHALGRPSLRGMGTTLAAVYVSVAGLTVVNVGDSRVYILDDRYGFRQASIDDVPGPAPILLSATSARYDEARLHSSRRSTHAITQAFGGNSSRLRPLNPHVVRLPAAERGWMLLLCSDGLSDFVDEWRLSKALASEHVSADDLVSDALAAGGGDNVSVIIARWMPVVAQAERAAQP